MSFDGDLYPEAGATSVMNAKGDIVRYDSERERYGIGSANQILQVKSSLPSWQTVPLADTVLTTAGDILYENATPALDRLPKGNLNDVLTMGASLPAWTAPAGGGGAWELLDVATSSGSTVISTFTQVDQVDMSCIVAYFRGAVNSIGGALEMQINGHTATDYGTDGFWTEGTSTGYQQTSSQSQFSMAMSGGSSRDMQVVSYINSNKNDKIQCLSSFNADNSIGMQTGYLNSIYTYVDEVKFQDASGSFGTPTTLYVYKVKNT